MVHVSAVDNDAAGGGADGGGDHGDACLGLASAVMSCSTAALISAVL